MTGLRVIYWIHTLYSGIEPGDICSQVGLERGFALNRLAEAIRAGELLPVVIFGTDSYGVCDRFSTHSPGGSDCNRASGMLFRLSDEQMHNQEVLAAFYAVLDEEVEP